MQVNDVMTKDCVTIESDSTCQDAAQLMKINNIGALPIMENKNLVGIITDRDIVLRSVSQNYLPSDCILKDFMSQSPITISPDADIHEAATIMAENQIRRLPVVLNNQLSGFISLGDLAALAKSEAKRVLEQVSKPIRRDVAA